MDDCCLGLHLCRNLQPLTREGFILFCCCFPARGRGPKTYFGWAEQTLEPRAVRWGRQRVGWGVGWTSCGLGERCETGRQKSWVLVLNLPWITSCHQNWIQTMSLDVGILDCLENNEVAFQTWVWHAVFHNLKQNWHKKENGYSWLVVKLSVLYSV